MKFSVLSDSPIEIHDPTTNEVLDVIDREKVRVRASDVRERITVCRTYRTTKVPGRRTMASLAALEEMRRLMEPEPEQIVVETLRVQDAQLPLQLKPEESYVKVNDRVVLVEEGDPSG
jgi:hypothetical protein